MRTSRTAVLALAAALTLAACHGERGGEQREAPVIDTRASGNSPERSTAVNDTTPHRPGQPDTTMAP